MNEYFETITTWLDGEYSMYGLAKIYGDIRAELEDAMRYACLNLEDYYAKGQPIEYVGNPTEVKNK